MNAAAIVGLALGMRHGADPDHLAAIDGLTRIRPRAANGVYFALGHGIIVVLLSFGVGKILANRFAFIGPWSLIAVGAVNLWRLFRGYSISPLKTPVVAQPFFLGMLLAAGFETSSQLSALILAGKTSAWEIGAAFSVGMILVDGLDGYLAASTQRLALNGYSQAASASKTLGVIVVLSAFGLGGAELAGVELDRFALPLGITLFAVVIGTRVWARWQSPSGAFIQSRLYQVASSISPGAIRLSNPPKETEALNQIGIEKTGSLYAGQAHYRSREMRP